MLLFPFRYLRWLVSRLRRSFRTPPSYVFFLLETAPPALPDPPVAFWQRPFSKPRLSVKELSERFEAIARDPRIAGVVLHLRAVPMPMATIQDLRELVAGLRAAGKRVVAWAPFYITGTYYLACACDEILVMPAGSVMPLGFTSTGMFLADGLARFGISADFIQVSPYKTAGDSLTKAKMTPEYREQITWLLDSHHKELIGAISESRRVDANAAQELVDSSPYSDDAALEQKVVDGLVAEDQLPEHLAQSGTPARIAAWEQARAALAAPRPTLGRGSYVAILRIEGTIMDGRSDRLPVKPPFEVPFVGDERAGDLTVVQAARQVAGDKRAAAAVLYVNSRGGSSTASEAMRQALERVNARIPIVVAMGPVAGSGGYDVSMPSRWIFARPGTLTGSIGVLGGKLVAGGLWSKLAFNRETIIFGKHAAMETDERPFTDDERQIVEREIARSYALFLEVVATSRKMPLDELQPIAGGRVWTGRQALEHKLVDELGGLEAAIRKARSLAGLKADAPAREPRAPRRLIPPRALPSAAAFIGYVLEGITSLNRAPTLAVMELDEGVG
jgi:protease IV